MIMREGEGRIQSEINVTPMIDVLLVLLILFIVIVPMVPRGEPAALPRAAAHNRMQPTTAVLEVRKGSLGETVFRINQQQVSRRDRPGRLAAIDANRAERVLFVGGDDQLSFREIAGAIDI